jgi:hypothetical protein
MKTLKQLLSEIFEKLPNTQYGSNSGGIHVDSDTGHQYYIKQYRDPEQAKSEALTGKIYDHMGINTIKPELHDTHSIKTKWNNDLGSAHSSELHNPTPENADHLAKMYHGAILTKNWDIVGLAYDNIMKHKNGSLYAIDHGGSFNFRAQGGHKDYTPDISEKQSLVNNDNPSGRVFSRLHKNHPEAIKRSLETVRNMDMNHIHSLFKNSGLKDWQNLHANFVKRRENLLNSY